MPRIILSALILIAAAGCASERPVQHRPALEGPSLFSKTHSQDEWSGNPVAVIQWTPPKKAIRGYALIINRAPSFEVQPLVNLEPEALKYTTPKLSEGVSYFHIRAIDEDDYPGKTAHYKLNICAELPKTPAVKSPTHPGGAGKNRNPKFAWEESGACVKGYYYSLSQKDNTEPDKFISNNGVEFHDVADGSYIFSLRAVGLSGKKGDVVRLKVVIRD